MMGPALAQHVGFTTPNYWSVVFYCPSPSEVSCRQLTSLVNTDKDTFAKVRTSPACGAPSMFTRMSQCPSVRPALQSPCVLFPNRYRKCIVSCSVLIVHSPNCVGTAETRTFVHFFFLCCVKHAPSFPSLHAVCYAACYDKFHSQYASAPTENVSFLRFV